MLDLTKEAIKEKAERVKKAAKAKGEEVPEKEKLNLFVSPDTLDRIVIHARKIKVTKSELMEFLADEILRMWRVQENTRATPKTGPATRASEAESDAPEPETLPISEEVNPSPIVDASATPGAGEGSGTPAPATEKKRRRA